MDFSEYFNCEMCKILVPHYASDIHEIECKRSESLTHPFIYGKILSARINIVSGDSSDEKLDTSSARRRRKRDSNVQHRLSMAEPVWMSRIKLPFKKCRIAFMNKVDLVLCGIDNFTPCLLTTKENYSCFCAMACEEINPGNVLIYNSGLDLLHISMDISFVLVESLEVKLAKEVCIQLSECIFIDSSIIKKCIEKSLRLGNTLEADIVYEVEQDISVRVLDQVVRGRIREAKTLDEPPTANLSVLQDDISRIQSSALDLSAINSTISTDSLCDGSDVEKLTSEVSKLLIKESKNMNSDKSYSSEPSQQRTTSTPKRTDDHNKISNKSGINLQNSSQKQFKKGRKCYRNPLEDIKANLKLPSYFKIDSNTYITFHCEASSGATNVNRFNKLPFHKTEEYDSLKRLVELKLRQEDMAGLLSWQGVLLSGLPGTGKTYLAHQLAKNMQLPLICLCLSDWLTSNLEVEEFVEKIFQDALQTSPSILFIDEVDALCPLLHYSKESSLARHILKHLRQLKAQSKKVFVLAATNRPECVSPKLRCPNVLAKEISIPLPDYRRRTDIISKLLSSRRHSVTQEQLDRLGKSAHGFSTSDLECAIRMANVAMMEAYPDRVSISKCEELQLAYEHLENGIESVVPPLLKLKHTAVSTVNWSDIFGYDDLKAKLVKMIREHSERRSSHHFKGVLLYGPPGCSKTMFVKALVTESRFTFFPLKCSDILSKYVGETEKALCTLFDQACLASPSIIFMDEVDALCAERTGMGATSSGIVAELLSLVNQSDRMREVLIVGATNRPHCIDEGLFSGNCFDWVIQVGLPDCVSRCDIWRGILQDVPKQEEICIQELCRATDGYSGAEIQGIYQQAAQSLLFSLDFVGNEKDNQHLAISEARIVNAIKTFPPRTSQAMLVAIQDFTNKRMRDRTLCI